MCLECLLPLATESNSESYRLLVGKSFVDVDRSVIRNLMMSKSIHFCSHGRRTCTCCSRIFRTMSNSERLFEVGTLGLGASKANVKPPLPRARGRSRFSSRDNLKRLRDKVTGSKIPQDPSGSNTVKILLHVGYTKLKISSDTESEFQYSEDDEEQNNGFCRKSCRKIEYDSQSDARDIRLGIQDSEVNPPVILDQPNLLDFSETKNDSSMSPDPFIEQVLIDLNWQESSDEPGPLLKEDLISLVDGLQQPVAAPGSIGASGDTCLPHMPAISILSEFLSLCSASPLVNNEETPKRIDAEDAHQAKHWEAVSGTRTDVSSHSNSMNEANALDGLSVTVSDFEGESIVDRLKRRIEHDQNCMNSLYKELEEERNVAATAANETMAMITRLQEEKAALQMEALQYLRMMEEQAEYDMEALERANDLLAEKEKEMQDLEYELEFYRNNFLDESGVVGMPNETSALPNDVVTATDNAPTTTSSNGIHKQNVEFEKHRISKCLRKLERKIYEANIPKSGMDAENWNNEVDDVEHISHNGLNGRSPTEHENDVLCGHSDRFTVSVGEIDAAAFEKQIAELRDQLEALDSDRSFLMHACLRPT